MENSLILCILSAILNEVDKHKNTKKMTTKKELKQSFLNADHAYQLAYAAYMNDGDFTKLKTAENEKKKAFNKLQKFIKKSFV